MYAFTTGVWSHSASFDPANVGERQAVFRPLTLLLQVCQHRCHYHYWWPLLCQFAMKSIHSFSKYRVDKFANGRTDGRTDGHVFKLYKQFSSSTVRSSFFAQRVTNLWTVCRLLLILVLTSTCKKWIFNSLQIFWCVWLCIWLCVVDFIHSFKFVLVCLMYFILLLFVVFLSV